MVADVDALQNLHLRGVGPPLVAAAAGVVSVAVTASVLPTAAIVLAVGLAVGGTLVPAVSGVLALRTGARQAGARGAMSAELADVLRAAPEIAVYGQEDALLAQIAQADIELTRISRRDAFAGGLGEGLGLVLMGLTVTGVLATAVSAHAAGSLDRTLVAALALLALASFEAVQPLAAAARELTATIAAGRRILELVDREPAVRDPAEPAPAPASFGITLEDVGARYAEREPRVLDGAQLRLDPGRRIALVGPSGAGKTTIANLLLRFLDPEQGRVTLGGRDLRDYRQEDVRRAIAVAGQDSYLFSTSIRENVRLARPAATDAEIEAALGQAQLLDWVKTLPDGMDTLVGEEGRELSGGQRQRLAIARALLAGAPVLVLDEPTAHLDPADCRRARARRPRRCRRPIRAAHHAPPRGTRPRRRRGRTRRGADRSGGRRLLADGPHLVPRDLAVADRQLDAAVALVGKFFGPLSRYIWCTSQTTWPSPSSIQSPSPNSKSKPPSPREPQTRHALSSSVPRSVRWGVTHSMSAASSSRTGSESPVRTAASSAARKSRAISRSPAAISSILVKSG